MRQRDVRVERRRVSVWYEVKGDAELLASQSSWMKEVRRIEKAVNGSVQ